MARVRVIPVARGKLKSLYGKHYFHVFLWSNQQDYEKAAEVERGNTEALCITHTHRDVDTGSLFVKPKLGELHFVSGNWSINTVAHEVTHAILHRLRYVHPALSLVLDENAPDHDPDHEEVIAYESGAWVEACLSWLSQVDGASPYPNLSLRD